MPKNHKNSFLSEPPKDLFERIMVRIRNEQRFSAIKQRLMVCSLGTACSAAALIPAFRAMQAGFNESGFFQFFSLIFSDFETIITHWQNFVMSLLETLPIMNLVVFLTIIFIILELTRFIARDIKLIYNSSLIKYSNGLKHQ